MTDPAPRPAPGSALARRSDRNLRRGMVHWFDPRLLLSTLFSLIVARLFASYADRREREGVHASDGPARYDHADELWLDYVADLGDGWDSTTTMAGLIGADSLRLPATASAAALDLPHGRVLLMGGDQVYPVASREEYLARLEAPYYSQHPYSPEGHPRDLFVLPGNHDWYDGLTSFSRLFLQQRWFAGWKSRQTRSYFALRLPQRWWLVAVDVQLDNDIDAAQLQYLQTATSAMAPGDRVILMSAVPFWLEEEGSVLRRNLAFLERRLVSERGARVYLSLAGDLHHYTRFSAADGRQRITAGGGGAFLHGTAWQPDALQDEGVGWTREKAFPTPRESRWMLWRVLCFPFYNPSFAIFLGVLSTLLLWGADATSHGIFFSGAAYGPGYALLSLLATLPDSPTFAAVFAVWFLGFMAFSEEPLAGPSWLKRVLKPVLGIVHASLHLLLAVAVTCWLQPSRLGDGFPQTLALLAFYLSLGSGLLFGIWVWILWQLLGCHHETAYSACRIRDWKHFLRLHIARDGTLTVHAIGVERVCRRWQDTTPAGRSDPLVVPADGRSLQERAALIEKITIVPLRQP